MQKGNALIRLGVAGLVVGLAVALGAPAMGAGFSIFEQGSRATGMGGAFVAVADDPSAMFYNPAGLAQIRKTTGMGGFTLIIPDAKMYGLNPYPGEGYEGKQKSMIFYPANLYLAMPLSECVTLGIGTWFPFGLTTAWDDPDHWAGRFISSRGELRSFAVGAQVAWQINDYIAIGGGPEMRINDVKLLKNYAALNPYTNRFVDVAHVNITSEGMELSFTFGAGIKINPTPELAIGASYHGAVDTDYTGDAYFYSRPTGYADFDGRIASLVPLDKPVPVETTIQYPAITQLGIAYTFAKKATLSFAANYTEWDVFDKTVLKFAPVDNKTVPTQTITHDYENTWAFRVGGNYKLGAHAELQLGFVYDQNPQPDKSVGPLLPDANRSGYSIGFSSKLFGPFTADLSYMYLYFHERTTTENKDNFNATYKTTAHLIGANLRATF